MPELDRRNFLKLVGASAGAAAGTAGGATTSGAAWERSTLRRGSSRPTCTRSARTTRSPSSSLEKRGAYRMYWIVRKITRTRPSAPSAIAIQ
ncbi:MAG: twin-arginine translocation signal domain-containing protein [Actinomycetota bacterium]